MSPTDEEHAGGQGTPRQEAAAGASDEKKSDAQVRMMLAAGRALVAASRHLLGAFRALAAAEAQLLWAAIPLFFIGAVAMVAFAVSLWVCLVALVGWALMLATHSAGIALGLLIVGHAILIVGVWFVIKYSVRQATFPRGRAELRRLGREMLRDISRFTDATPATDPARSDEATRAPHEQDKT